MSDERTKQLREASGSVVYTDALTSFLYELIRDHMPAGTVEKLVRSSIEHSGEVLFTNGWLAQYSNNLAQELTNAKTNNLTKVLSDAFGLSALNKTADDRPSFKFNKPDAAEEVKKLEDRVDDGKKIIDTLVSSGQLKQEDAEIIKKEIDEFEAEATTPNVYIGVGGEPVKGGDSVVITNDSPSLKFKNE